MNGALVRDKLNPAIPNWKEVPENKKNELWDRRLKLNFRFLEGKHELVKKYFQDHGKVIPTLEVRAQQELYPKGVNSLQRVWQHNSQSMGGARGSEDFTGGIGA